MKKWISMLILVTFSVIMLGPALASDDGSPGPAPNAGDGVSDGSGMDGHNGDDGDSNGDSPGPAPNSGDGVSDGSGMDSPNGPNGK